MKTRTVVAIASFLVVSAVQAQETAAPGPDVNPKFDAALATQVGADEYGMKNYILVVLKTGPNRVPDGKERDEMFQGHFANMKRLSTEGKLALAGPLDGVDGWRGLFVFSTDDLEEARKLVATDPVIIHGEMVAEYHKYYGSAALMLVSKEHDRVKRKDF